MPKDPDQANLFVRKFSFKIDDDQCNVSFDAFFEQFFRLTALCPNIETLDCSWPLQKYVVVALHRLRTPLKNLSVFPYSEIPEYRICTRRYNQTLKECTSLSNFKELKLFPRLQKAINLPLKSIQDVECVLSMCPNLKNLSVMLNSLEGKNVGDEKYTGQMQEYPKMKRLRLVSKYDIFLLKIFIPLLRKFTRLERLELQAFRVLETQRPNHQLGELKALFDFMRVLPFASFNIVGSCFDSLLYLKLFFGPDYLWKPTNILRMLCTQPPDHGTLFYKTTNNNNCILSIVLPDSVFYVRNVHDSYIETFAPYVKMLELDYADIFDNNKPCESFLDTVFKQCNVLHKLTIYNGFFALSLPSIIISEDALVNSIHSAIITTLHAIVFEDCLFEEPDFLTSISYACPNLRQLTLSGGHFNDLDCIMMPETELEHLDLDLSRFTMGNQEREELFLKIIDSKRTWHFYTNFKKKQFMMPLEWPAIYIENQGVVLKFKKIERLKVCYQRYEDILELSN
jgi:hypothetical protein